MIVLTFLVSFLALLENIRSEQLFLAHAPLVMLGAYPKARPKTKIETQAPPEFPLKLFLIHLKDGADEGIRTPTG